MSHPDAAPRCCRSHAASRCTTVPPRRGDPSIPSASDPSTRAAVCDRRRRAAWRARMVALLVAGAATGCVQREAVVMSRDVVTTGATRESTGQAVRPGRNLPAAFEVVVPSTVRSDCAPVLRDPDMQTELTLHNSVLQAVRDSLGTHYRAVGDYAVEPRGRYGDEQPGDGVRIDCARLRALGIVRLGSSGE